MPRFNRPERRNRNIGTSKQGHGRDNRLVIPERWSDSRSFLERLGSYRKVRREIRGEVFTFVVESTRKQTLHPCTIDDLAHLLQQLNPGDFPELRTIVLRQPKRKETILSPVWGRLQYSYTFEGRTAAVIILEAVQPGRMLAWPKKSSPDGEQELDRLRSDGHAFSETRREYEAPMALDACRATQLYRTLPHEIGHFVNYNQMVERPLSSLRQRIAEIEAMDQDNSLPDDHPLNQEWNRLSDEEHSAWKVNWDRYWGRPQSEREVFAHRFADEAKARLERANVIPFPRRLAPKRLEEDGLSIDDFIVSTTSPPPTT